MDGILGESWAFFCLLFIYMYIGRHSSACRTNSDIFPKGGRNIWVKTNEYYYFLQLQQHPEATRFMIDLLLQCYPAPDGPRGLAFPAATYIRAGLDLRAVDGGCGGEA